MVGQFGQLLDADAGHAENFDGGPGPERLMLLQRQVPALAGGGIFCPDPGGGTAAAVNRPPQRLASCGEQRARGGGPGQVQQLCGLPAGLVHRGGQGRQDRQALAGPLVHPGLALAMLLLAGQVLVADRAGRCPPCPPGRVLHRPLGDIEVEGADGRQVVQCAQARAAGLGDLPGAGPGPGCLDSDPLLPGGRHLRRQPQGTDARVVEFQVAPEQLAQAEREVLQRRVVDRGLAFPQIFGEQVADRLAFDAVPADQLRRGQLAAGVEGPHRRRR